MVFLMHSVIMMGVFVTATFALDTMVDISIISNFSTPIHLKNPIVISYPRRYANSNIFTLDMIYIIFHSSVYMILELYFSNKTGVCVSKLMTFLAGNLGYNNRVFMMMI